MCCVEVDIEAGTPILYLRAHSDAVAPTGSPLSDLGVFKQHTANFFSPKKSAQPLSDLILDDRYIAIGTPCGFSSEPPGPQHPRVTAQVLLQTALNESGDEVADPSALVNRVYRLMSKELGVDPDPPVEICPNHPITPVVQGFKLIAPDIVDIRAYPTHDAPLTGLIVEGRRG